MISCILFIIPVIVSAKITVNIDVASNKSDINIKYSGNDHKIATDTIIRIFNVTTHNLNKGIRIEMGKVPDSIFLKDPTVYGDSFRKFKWEPVKRVVNISKAIIIDIINEETVLKTHEFINNSTVLLKSKRSLYETVENTARCSWDDRGLPNDDILYDVDLNFGYDSFKYQNKWRNNSFHSIKMSIGVTEKGMIDRKPFSSVVSKLFATKTTVLIELEYMAKLVGSVMANYAKVYGNYHFWAPSIENIMNAAEMKNEIITKELIEIRCFLNPRLIVYDGQTGEMIEPPRKKRPLVKILRNRNTTRFLYLRMKKPKPKQKDDNIILNI